MGRDWQEWHEAYADPSHPHVARLAAVTNLLIDALDGAPPGPLRLASLCAGEGRDVVGALARHPRRDDVTVRLVELDAVLAERARAALERAGIPGEVVTGDAGDAAVVADVVPVDVLLLCGIFGNIADADVQRTVEAVPRLCRSGATVIWTRHRRQPDLTPAIRRWFADVGAEEVAFASGGPEGWSVGVARTSRTAPFQPAPLFRFTR